MKDRILVVEDDEATLEAILLKFKAAGLDTDFAKDGIEGLNKLREKNFSMVLLDLRMPRADGFWLMEEKNKVESIKAVPVVVFSNYSQPEFTNRALALGAKGYLVKSQHSITELVEVVQAFLATGEPLFDK